MYDAFDPYWGGPLPRDDYASAGNCPYRYHDNVYSYPGQPSPTQTATSSQCATPAQSTSTAQTLAPDQKAAPAQTKFHCSNPDGSYSYSNADGSKYYNNGAGLGIYTSPSGNTYVKKT